MRVRLSAIDMDAGIRCRARISVPAVKDLADKLSAGAVMPAVILFGTEDRCWIGDGWYRVTAAKAAGMTDIDCVLRQGGRKEAAEFALSRSAARGRARTRADKQRAVDIGIAEFEGSERDLAKLCGVHRKMFWNRKCRLLRAVESGDSAKPEPKRPEITIGSRKPKRPEITIGSRKPKRGGGISFKPAKTVSGSRNPPAIGMQYAKIAIRNMENIDRDDIELLEAFQLLEAWINENYPRPKV